MPYFPENLDDWRKISFLIERSEKIFISTHVNPDGDAIGSEMALAEFLSKMGKVIRIINHSPTPDAFFYLDPQEKIEFFQDDLLYTIGPKKSDMVFFLDMGKYERAGRSAEFLAYTSAAKVIIDHHPPEPVEADVVVINTNAASTGSLVYDLICHIDSSLINKEIALAMMTAIVTDTGYFRYSNTTATTHLIASSLYQYGVRAINVRKQIEKGYPVCRQILLSMTLNNLKTNSSDEVAYSLITKSMFEEAGAKREHTDGIIDQLRIIKGIKIVFLVIQEGENKYKVSFRSGDGISVNVIASKLGGGGHPRAAGANMTGSLEHVTNRVLDVVEDYLKSNRHD